MVPEATKGPNPPLDQNQTEEVLIIPIEGKKVFTKALIKSNVPQTAKEENTIRASSLSIQPLAYLSRSKSEIKNPKKMPRTFL
tara:strand:- start:278 stop:526 length:249 start_codon:yes stop_codon:yes gene_type:complete